MHVGVPQELHKCVEALKQALIQTAESHGRMGEGGCTHLQCIQVGKKDDG